MPARYSENRCVSSVEPTAMIKAGIMAVNEFMGRLNNPIKPRVQRILRPDVIVISPTRQNDRQMMNERRVNSATARGMILR